MPPRAKPPWFRFYVEAVSDPKLRRRKPEHRWLWVCVLAAGRMSPVPGCLVLSGDELWTDGDLADFAGMPLASVRVGMAEFEKAGMVDRAEGGAWRVVKWDQRQYESDTSTERVRRHRDRNANETPMERSINAEGTGQSQSQKTETDPSSSSVLPVDSVVGDVCDHVAEIRTRKAKAAGTIKTSERGYRDKTRLNLPAEIGPRVLELVDTYDETPRRLAEIIEGSLNGRNAKRREVAS